MFFSTAASITLTDAFQMSLMPIALNKWDDGVVKYIELAIWYGNCWSTHDFLNFAQM